ncbi:hypothetical protein Y032_0005g2495 [Ancylostoma ceylanicum]|uniref:Uncharacterized protein n=1 Tax=Ancylostoma ceylanicum TaxID=53326 RepID=A0A016VS93_9BILA|nr:hypothetical protein Y032_0005g2495 [Ancylostoma ceylanicum]
MFGHHLLYLEYLSSMPVPQGFSWHTCVPKCLHAPRSKINSWTRGQLVWIVNFCHSSNDTVWSRILSGLLISGSHFILHSLEAPNLT